MSTPSNLIPSTWAAAVRFEHRVQVDRRLGAGAPLADDAGPHRVVNFGKSVGMAAAHRISFSNSRSSSTPELARVADREIVNAGGDRGVVHESASLEPRADHVANPGFELSIPWRRSELSIARRI